MYIHIYDNVVLYQQILFDMCYSRATELSKSRFITRKQQSRHVQVFGQKFTCYSFCNYRVFLSISQIWHMKLYPCHLFLYRLCFYGFCFENKITTTNNLHKTAKLLRAHLTCSFDHSASNNLVSGLLS